MCWLRCTAAVQLCGSLFVLQISLAPQLDLQLLHKEAARQSVFSWGPIRTVRTYYLKKAHRDILVVLSNSFFNVKSDVTQLCLESWGALIQLDKNVKSGALLFVTVLGVNPIWMLSWYMFKSLLQLSIFLYYPKQILDWWEKWEIFTQNLSNWPARISYSKLRGVLGESFFLQQLHRILIVTKAFKHYCKFISDISKLTFPAFLQELEKGIYCSGVRCFKSGNQAAVMTRHPKILHISLHSDRCRLHCSAWNEVQWSPKAGCHSLRIASQIPF